MLEMRPACECCQAALPSDQDGAWICSYECTFCSPCTTGPLAWTCPNCGGVLHPRPPRRSPEPAADPPSNPSCDLIVRSAVMTELPWFAGIFDAYRRFYGQPSDLGCAEDFLRARLGRGQSLLFGAWRRHDLLGFCQIYPGFSSVAAAPVWVLNDLFVRPDARRQGVADALMAACETAARTAGVRNMRLESALDNRIAQALYTRRGWRRADGFITFEWSAA